MKTITKKAYGKNIKITDARDNFDLAINNAYGKTEQDTTSGKNLLDCNSYGTTTNKGITLTGVTDDKGLLQYINMNGTATETTSFYIKNSVTFSKDIEYVMSGCPKLNGVFMYLGQADNGANRDYGDGVELSFTEDKTSSINIMIPAGTVCNNVKIYPMIRLASITDATYEPFTNGPSPNPDYPQEIKSVVLSEIKTTNSDGSLESVATLSNPITLNGLNGVWDTLERKEWYVKVFDGTESLLSWTNTSGGGLLLAWNNENIKPSPADNIPFYGFCNYLSIVSSGSTWGSNKPGFAVGTNLNQIRFRLGEDITTVAQAKEWLAEKYAEGNPFTIVVPIAEPNETQLPDADVEALKSLKTYDGVTHIFTDSEVEPTLEVEYTLLEAKEEWNYTDYILHTDYNRIVGNINYLKAYLDTLFIGLDNLPTMEEKNSKSLIYAREINAIETALETLNLETYKFDIGETKEYLPNTRTLNFEDLNRIESAIFMLAEQMTSHKENLTRLAFTLGNQKGIRV